MSARPARNQPYQRPRRIDPATESTSADSRVNRLIVSGLHYEITEPDLVKIFQPYGTFTRKPTIRYDRSGRSTGFAYVNYETVEEASLAQRELDGVLAKGEPIKVSVESFVPKGPRKGEDNERTAAGRTIPLKDRLRKPLLHRLTDDKKKEDTMDVDDAARGPGPVRHNRGQPRGGKPNRAPKAPPKPKTAADLDKELEAYVESGAGDAKAKQDVEM